MFSVFCEVGNSLLSAKPTCKIRARGQQKYDAFWISGPKNTKREMLDTFQENTAVFIINKLYIKSKYIYN